MNFENPITSSSTSSFIKMQTNKSCNILEAALDNILLDNTLSELFPEGPTKMTTLPTLIPQQILPPTFKMPPQIDCLSQYQDEQSISNLKALLVSWGMLQLFDWFVGKLSLIFIFYSVKT